MLLIREAVYQIIPENGQKGFAPAYPDNRIKAFGSHLFS